MKRILLALVMGIMLFALPASALNIEVETDKDRVSLGEDFKISGRVTSDDGMPGEFEIRVSAVAPEKAIVCDSGRTKTDDDGRFTLNCKAPTQSRAITLGIDSAEGRTIIPLRAGVAVKDPANSEVVKKHAQPVLAINDDKFEKHIKAVSDDINRFVKASGATISECEKVAEKSGQPGFAEVVATCQITENHLRRAIEGARGVSDQIKKLSDDSSSSEIEDVRDKLVLVRDVSKTVTHELKDAIELNLRARFRGIEREREAELRGRANEPGEDVQGNADENELRGRDNEFGEDVQGNADENEVRGRGGDDSRSGDNSGSVSLNSGPGSLSSRRGSFGDDRTRFRAELLSTNNRDFGHADFRIRDDRLKLSVEVEDMQAFGLMNGDVVCSQVNGVIVGCEELDITVSNGLFSDLDLDSRHGDTIPMLRTGDVVKVTDQAGKVILSGKFMSDDPGQRSVDQEILTHASIVRGDDELRGRENELGEDVRGQENELRGRANEPGEDVRGNELVRENELRGRVNEPGEDVRGNADENEVRGRGGDDSGGSSSSSGGSSDDSGRRGGR